MPNVDQGAPALKINQAVDGYRDQRDRLEKLRQEIRSLQSSGQSVPDHLATALDKSQQLLDHLQRALVCMHNDNLRQHLAGGQIMMTAGVQSQGAAFVTQAITAIRAFDAFTSDNDPYEEHDFGAIELDGHKLFFKIDAYDRDLCHGSPDPADPALTVRVMTVMLAEEY